jgi:ribosomal-protein-alanine N-acetyltransferase
MSTFNVRRLSETDIPAVLSIGRRSPGSAQWTARQYATVVSEDSKADGLVVEADGSVIAFLTYLSAVTDEAELTNLAVEPAFRRRGLAQQLLSDLRRKVTADIFLEVRAGNDEAQELYRKAGFVTIGRRKNYYQDPPDDAVMMKSTRRSKDSSEPADRQSGIPFAPN